MNEEMAEVSDEELVRRALEGDSASLAMLLDRHRDRLEKMVRARLDRSLQGRFDPADVLQETFVDLAQQLGNYPGPEAMPVFLWLRLLTGQRLSLLKRMHQGAARRSAGREISVGGEVHGEADSASIADFLVARLTTASRAVDRAERARLVREAIEALNPIDREIISLRSFEELTNGEVAAVLGLSKAAASNRYVRAMGRLQVVFQSIPGLIDGDG
jgi:RNA polymerase sigma-70 factor (ECF subfamily)